MKTCNEPSCNLFVFGGGYCLAHQYKRKQARNKPIKPRSTIRRYKLPTSNKQGLKTNKKALVESWGFTTQIEMFNHIWATRPHICQFTGSDLDLVPSYQYTWIFMHILRKGKYPFWKYNPDNIVLGHPNFHLAADNFTEEERTKHPDWNFDLWFSLVEKKKEEYKKFLLDNML